MPRPTVHTSPSSERRSLSARSVRGENRVSPTSPLLLKERGGTSRVPHTPSTHCSAQGRAVSSGYLSLTDADREEMLAAIGVSTVDDLFEQVPAGVRLDRELDA